MYTAEYERIAERKAMREHASGRLEKPNWENRRCGV